MTIRNSLRRAVLTGLLLLLCNPALADRIYFSNGESITGTLEGVEQGKVQWTSPMLGSLNIEQHHVSWIETDERYDLKTSRRTLTNCWMYKQRERQLLQCDEGVHSLTDWKLVVKAGEALQGPQPFLTQTGGVVIAAENSSGNNNIDKYNVDARTELRLIETRHTLALRYQEESAEGQNTRNMWRTSYQYDQFFTQQWFLTGNAFYEEDEFRELDQRYSAGIGMGYQFLETSYFDLNGKGTINYVDEQFDTGEQRQRPALLWNLDFKWRFNDRGVEMYHRHFLLQSFTETDDFEISTVTGFKYPISGKLNSVIQLEYDYDNLPAEGNVDKRDQKWSIGLNYDW
ncbi:MAG: DUF481 domain-containing protein [Pseudomonadota bacterium]